MSIITQNWAEIVLVLTTVLGWLAPSPLRRFHGRGG
jgi:hypothetical protein